MTVNRGRVGLLCAALESGLYEQGRLKLHRKDQESGTETWCCLGVAGDVAARFGADIRRGEWMMSRVYRNPEPEDQIWCELIAGSCDIMGHEVQDWYGFEDPNPRLRLPDGTWYPAAEMNDGAHISFSPEQRNGPLSFAEIAAAFRRTYLEESS